MTPERHLKVSGQKVLIIGPQAPPYGGMALQGAMLERLLRADGMSVVFFPSNLAFPPGLRFVDRIRGFRPFARSILTSIKLWGKIRQVDVVHILACSRLYFFLVVAPAVILSRMRRKRVILNYRSGDAKQFFRRYKWIVKPFFLLADSVTAPSGFLVEAIQESFKILVSTVPNIVDFSAFQYRERKQLQPRMLVTRHLEKLYDVELVLRAFRRIQERYPQASLDIAGTGSEEQRLRAVVATWRLQNVRFLGHVLHRDLPAIYDRCDILLNGSRVDNFPASLMEASASGLVVISTKAGGIPFIYQDGKNAILVELGDWEALAAGVERVLAEPSLGQRLASEAVQLSGQCDWQNVRRLLYQSYGFGLPEDVANIRKDEPVRLAAVANTVRTSSMEGSS